MVDAGVRVEVLSLRTCIVLWDNTSVFRHSTDPLISPIKVIAHQ
jgi:hypothetical protein